MIVETVQNECKREETVVEVGGGAGLMMGGTAGGACAVQ